METMTREEIKVGQVTIRFLVESEDSNGSVTVFEAGVPAGPGCPRAQPRRLRGDDRRRRRRADLDGG
jgi:hypothetical protein